MSIERKAFHQLSYGLYLASAEYEGERAACVINTAVQVSSNPFQLVIIVNKDNHTHALIEKSKKFLVMALNQHCDMDFIRNFGFQSSKDVDKFKSFETGHTSQEHTFVDSNEVSAVFECKVTGTLDGHTHTIFLGEVIEAFEHNTTEKPLTYDYDRGVLKGKTPPKASSYVGDEPENTDRDLTKKGLHRFECQVCGYIYETEEDELPDDFICPLCKAPKEKFKKLS